MARLPVVLFSKTFPSAVFTVSVIPPSKVVGGTTSQKVVAVSAVDPRVTGVSILNVTSWVAEASICNSGAASTPAMTVALPARGSFLLPLREMEVTETSVP